VESDVIHYVPEVAQAPRLQPIAKDEVVTVEAGGQGSGEQGEDCNRACTPPQSEHPETTGLDTHISLRFTGTGEKDIPLPPAPFPLAYKVKTNPQLLLATTQTILGIIAIHTQPYFKWEDNVNAAVELLPLAESWSRCRK
jgi:hypothetical protein